MIWELFVDVGLAIHRNHPGEKIIFFALCLYIQYFVAQISESES